MLESERKLNRLGDVGVGGVGGGLFNVNPLDEVAVGVGEEPPKLKRLDDVGVGGVGLVKLMELPLLKVLLIGLRFGEDNC